MNGENQGTDFYRGAPQQEALARLHYAVENRLRVAALTGQAGVGKSRLLAEFAREQRKQGAAVALIGGFEPRQMLWMIAAQWGLFPDVEAPVFALWQAIADRLVQLRCENRTGLLLVDSSDCERPVLQLVRQLLAADPHPESRLSLILAFDAELISALPEDFKDLVDLRIELEPWDRSDIQAVVAADRFTPAGYDELHSLTAGIARQVIRLARFASLAAAAEQLGSIDGETLVAVQDELLLH